MNRIGDWVETYTGRRFWPLDPRPEEVCIEDIAHALSLVCRFNGHCKHFYSVAHHSLLCAVLASYREYNYRIRLLALLHDAAEAYASDIMRPIKPFINGYIEIENKIYDAILESFGIRKATEKEKAIVDELDTIMLATEAKQIMPFKGWKSLPYPPDEKIIISNTAPGMMENVFNARFKKYLSKIS